MLDKIRRCWRRGALCWLGLTAFIWRIVLLGKADLWGDEILYAQRSSPPTNPVNIFLSHMKAFPDLPYLPLPSIIQNTFLWIATLFSDDVLHNAFAQRFPAAVFGALTVPFVYLLIRAISNHRTALLTALMQCFFYVPIYFSREARFYAPLLFFVVILYLLYFRVLVNNRCGLKYGVGIVLTGVIVCHMTLNGILYVGGLMGISVLSLVFRWRSARTDPDEWKRLHAVLFILLGISTLTFLPLLIEFLSKGTGLASSGIPSLWIIIRDLFGRILMGANTAQWWVSALLLVSGLYFIVRAEKKRYFQHAFLLSMASVFVLTLVNVVRSEYYFLRLFLGQTPGVYWIAATGVAGLFLRTINGKSRVTATRLWLYRLCLAILLGIHALLFAPQFWILDAKSDDYGGTARWLNQHLEAGTPYVVESAYQLRFISGHYETPDIIPAVPYVHGSGEGELSVLRKRQRDFLTRFPEAYYVESAFHEPPWDWPKEYFAQRVKLENKPLRYLISWGIHSPSYQTNPAQYMTYIYYNTPEDVQRLLKEQGESVYLEYPEWHCVAYARFQYSRFVPGESGIVKILNLENQPITGHFEITGVLLAGSKKKCDITINFELKEILRTRQNTMQAWNAQTEVVEIPLDWTELKLKALGLSSNQKEGFLLLDIKFHRSEKHMEKL